MTSSETALNDEELITYLRFQGLDKDIAAADRIEELMGERDEALNQLDSTRHSVDVLEKRLTDKMAKLAKALDGLRFVDDGANHGAMTPTYSEHALRYILRGIRDRARAVLEELGEDA